MSSARRRERRRECCLPGILQRGEDPLWSTAVADERCGWGARAAQIGRDLDRYEREWTAAHPGQVPGPGLRRAWDARAWAEGRPDEVTPGVTPEDGRLLHAAALPQEPAAVSSAAVARWGGHHVVTDSTGRQTSTWAIERAIRSARPEIAGLPEASASMP